MNQRFKLGTKTLMTQQLCRHLLKSITQEGDTWVCQTFKGTRIIMPFEATAMEVFERVYEVNYAEGFKHPTPTGVKEAQVQLGLFT